MFPSSVSDDIVYSGNFNRINHQYDVGEEGIESIEPYYVSDNATVKIYTDDISYEKLDIYKSFRVEVLEGELKSLDIYLDEEGFENWLNRTGFEYYQYTIIKHDRRVMPLENKNKSGYKGVVYDVGHNFSFSIVGAENMHEGYQLSVDSSNESCGQYWRPKSSYREVKNCEQEEASINNEFKHSENRIIYVVSVALCVVLIIYLISRRLNHNQVEEVEERTQQIIEKMKEGKISNDDDNLKSLFEANKKASNGKTDEALNILTRLDEESNSFENNF